MVSECFLGKGEMIRIKNEAEILKHIGILCGYWVLFQFEENESTRIGMIEQFIYPEPLSH